jgi:hypothetical protein
MSMTISYFMMAQWLDIFYQRPVSIGVVVVCFFSPDFGVGAVDSQ